MIAIWWLIKAEFIISVFAYIIIRVFTDNWDVLFGNVSDKEK